MGGVSPVVESICICYGSIERRMPQFPLTTTVKTSEVLLEPRGPPSFPSVREGVRDRLQELCFLQYRDKQSKAGRIFQFCLP